MPIEMMPIPRGQAMIAAFWPPEHLNEDAYAAASQNEMSIGSMIGESIGNITKALTGVGSTSTGATSSALQGAYGGNIDVLTQQQGIHNANAGNLAMQSQNLFNTKNLLNIIAWEAINLLQGLATALLGNPITAMGYPAAEAMVNAQAQGMAGMVGNGYNATANMLGQGMGTGNMLNGIPGTMPGAMTSGMGYPMMGQPAESYGGYAPQMSWGAQPGIPQQLQNMVMGQTPLVPAPYAPGQTGSVIDGLMQVAPQIAAQGNEAAQQAINQVHEAAQNLTRAAAQALNIDPAQFGVDDARLDENDAAAAKEAQDKGLIPADDGAAGDAGEGDDKPQQGGTPPPVAPNQGQGDGDKVAAQEADDPDDGGASTEPPTDRSEAGEKKADWGLTGELRLDTPFGDARIFGGAEAGTQLSSAGAPVLDTPGQHASTVGQTTTTVSGAGAAPAGAMPMGAMPLGAAAPVAGQSHSKSALPPLPVTDADRAHDRSVVDQIAAGDLASGIDTSERAAADDELIHTLSERAQGGARVVAQLLTAHEDAGCPVENVAVAMYADRDPIYNTSDVLGLSSETVALPKGTPLMAEIASNLSQQVDTAKFLADWIGYSDPALVLALAAECQIIPAPDVIVTTAPENDTVPLRGVEYMSTDLARRITPVGKVEDPLGHLRMVQEGDVTDVVSAIRREWNDPEQFTAAQCRKALSSRRWTEATNPQAQVATVWWMAAEAVEALENKRVDQARRLAMLMLALPDPVRRQAPVDTGQLS